MKAPTPRTADGARSYGPDEGLAALALAQWGLHLDQLDDLIEAAGNDAGFLVSERARIIKIVQERGAMAARADARVLAALLREAAQVPMVHLGEAMSAGRKKGTVGKVRAWVRKYMVKYPTAMPAQAWEAFKKRPPKGCSVYENRLGKYIETEGAPDTSRAWFGTIVGQERPKK